MNLFQYMTCRHTAWPFLIIIPATLITLAALGWTRENIVEENINRIWTSKESRYQKNLEYAANLDRNDHLSTTFAATSVSRDGGNLFTSKRLEEIRARMEYVESTTVEYKGHIFTWNDVCQANNVGLGTTYKFVCLRLSFMDLFQEARWYFDETDRITWYRDAIRKILLLPRVPRFGIMNQVCSSAGSDQTRRSRACDTRFALRTNATFAVENGFPATFANPLELFSDIGSLEFNDPCRACIEENIEDVTQILVEGVTNTFKILALELQNLFESGTVVDPEQLVELEDLLATIGDLAQNIGRKEVEDFYYYYVVRGLYAELGHEEYANRYKTLMQNLRATCLLATSNNVDICQPTVDEETARAHLLAHADNEFSSVTTAGAPFPFWSNGNGTGDLFGGTSPVGGSGIDLSGTLLSTTSYVDAFNFGTSEWSPLFRQGLVDPFGALWNFLVDSDPMYRWFLAGKKPFIGSCGNGNLTGTAIPDNDVINQLDLVTQRWCTKFNVPYDQDENRTVQHFARMFYDLLIDSNAVLNIEQGESDPYTWTNGQGCGYDLKGERDMFRDKNTSEILRNASRYLYNVDEGALIGALDRNLLIGGAFPAVGDYNFDNPLEQVTLGNTFYPANGGLLISKRVANCNRPGGSINITKEDGTEVLKLFKKAFEDRWIEGWDDPDAGEVQFVGFFDDIGGIGTTGRLLKLITLDNGTLMAISIAIIAVFSAVFLFSFDVVESRVFVTMIGVALVILSLFAALAVGILFGIKISLSIAWTLPFIILGLGVDDMYIIILALKRRGSYSKEDFVAAMAEVVVPVTMTSIVNASMFAIMTLVTVPAVRLTAQMALISVIFLWLTVILCFPAYCYLDMKRQKSGRYDVFFCFRKKKTEEDGAEEKPPTAGAQLFIYEGIYRPIMLGRNPFRTIVHSVIWLGGIAFLAVGVYGITRRRVGVGLADIFPRFHSGHRWALLRATEVATWPLSIQWEINNYTDPVTQMKLIKQFERIVATPHISEIDTSRLWLASFNIWTSRHCGSNFVRDDPNVLQCGRDQVWPVDNSPCAGTWMPNTLGLREKIMNELECTVHSGGVCRPTSQMHPLDLADLGTNASSSIGSWCPVFEGWSQEKFAFCLRRWSNYTGGGGDLVSDEDTRTPYEQCEGDSYNDPIIKTPLPYSRAPDMFAFNLNTHEDTLDMIEETRRECDEDAELQCTMIGIPFSFWEQYLWVDNVLLNVGLSAVGIGLGVSFLFLWIKIMAEGRHPLSRIVTGSLVGGLLICVTTVFSLVSVIGLSALVGVNFSAFSIMSFVLSVGFAVEYSVHIVHRFLKAPLSLKNALDRVEHAMSFLALPTFMSFVSSTIGVVCLAFTAFQFNSVYFFRPMIIVMFVTYFYGCWFLPALLTTLNGNVLRLGRDDTAEGVPVAECLEETNCTEEEELKPGST